MEIIVRLVNKMNLNDFKVLEIRYPHSVYKLSKEALILDEGKYYRIDSTHIIDKYRIQNLESTEDKIIIHMKDDDDIILKVKRK